MSDFVSFGSPGLFEISARWSDDVEPRDRLPLEGGWSTGDLRITVGDRVLTARSRGGAVDGHLSWYLSPIFEWLISQWTWLFHEEAYAWPEKSGAPAAVATFSALGRYIAAEDEKLSKDYREVQAWWERHALRAADPSAIYPDICFRRLDDDIEISWGGRQPAFAPEGFSLMISPGFASLPVEAVVVPLWQFLEWGTSTAEATNPADVAAIRALRERLRLLKQTPLRQLELRHIDSRLHQFFERIRAPGLLERVDSRVKDVPAIAAFDPAVLMFGGLAPDIGMQDAQTLTSFLARHQHGVEGESLKKLVSNDVRVSGLEAYYEGYELAYEVRARLDIDATHTCVNVRGLLRDLGVHVEEVALETDSIRGVAVAGQGFGPAILINASSIYNKTEDGRRFTLAHELCHILFDRTRARRLSHVSGPWTAPRVEKRANAFAAMFMASTTAMRKLLVKVDVEHVSQLAKTFQMGFSALVEHLYNADLISDADRERLRLAVD
jgi:Zn-dependent peptidase ImmA (M78 family)